MSKPPFLSTSLKQLTEITEKTHNKQIAPIANAIWQKHLQPENPLWKFVTARSFSINDNNGSAHVLAMVDKRLPQIGLVGFFGCTNSHAGAAVLEQAAEWLSGKHKIKDVYGPINGTITRDYRLNLADDFAIPGEPVNPAWYINAFREAGFKIYNRYVSGISKHYQLFIKPFVRKPSSEYSYVVVRPFDAGNQDHDFKTYHSLMNAIFPSQSVYCPVLSQEERIYNMAGSGPVFNPQYTYFLEDKDRAIGFIVSFPYKNQLVVKTIGVLPEYRGNHLAGLLIKRVHDQAKQDGLAAVIYSTIRVGNAVYKMRRPGVKVFRKYVTMHKSL